jgi:hypothetical protein
MKKLLIIAVLSLFGLLSVYCQGDLTQEASVYYRNERSFAIKLNTNGWGLNYMEGKRINYLNKKLLEFELSILKDPKEVKMTNPYWDTPGNFIFGKLNSVFLLRGGIGRQRELYKKADLGGVSVRYFYTGGPVLAVYKPIYYKIINWMSQYEYEIKEEKFDVKKHDPTMIYSKAAFTKGLDETKVLPGLYAKAGFNFEYSKKDKVLHAIEIGSQIELFPKKIPIMATTSNKSVFLSLFASYRFGVVINPYDTESSKMSGIFSGRRK